MMPAPHPTTPITPSKKDVPVPGKPYAQPAPVKKKG